MSKIDEDRIREAARKEAEQNYAAEVEDRIAADAARIANARITALRRAEREEVRAKQAEREEAELTKQAERAWRQTFGAKLAARLRLRVAYYLLRDGSGQAWAFTDPAARKAVAGLVETFDRRARVRTDGPVEGIGLAGAVSPDRLVAVDPPLADFEAMVAEREQRQLIERRRQAEAEAGRRRKRRERAVFGVALDPSGRGAGDR